MYFDSPEAVLQSLKKGHERFMKRSLCRQNYDQRIKETSDGQSPQVLVLACMDSRCIPEFIFDQGIGQMISLRVAGNIVNTNVLASIEYAVLQFPIRVVLLLGHTRCSAVSAACHDPSSLSGSLDPVIPAIKTVENVMPTCDRREVVFIEAVIKQNVLHGIDRILQDSSLLSDKKSRGELCILGGVYQVSTGQVVFLKA